MVSSRFFFASVAELLPTTPAKEETYAVVHHKLSSAWKNLHKVDDTDFI